MIKAVGKQIVVKPIFEKKQGSIILPDKSVKQVAEFHGRVVSVGPDYPHKAHVKVDDKVLYMRNEGTEVGYEGDYLSLKPEWILAVLED